MTSPTRLIARCLTTIVVVALVVSPLAGTASGSTLVGHSCCARVAAKSHCQSVTVLQCCRAPERPDSPAAPAPAPTAAQPVTFLTAGPADVVSPPHAACLANSLGEARRIIETPPLYLLHAVLLV